MNSVEFLDAVRVKLGLDSDNKLARELGIERARVSAYRCGRRKLDPDAAMAVAKALELPPEHVFAAVAAERAKRTEHRAIWERLASIARNAHVLAFVGFAALSSTPAPSPAAEVAAQECIFCQIGRRERRRRRRARRITRTAATAAAALILSACANLRPWVGEHPALSTLAVVGTALVAGKAGIQHDGPTRTGLQPRVCQRDANACM